MAYRSFLFFSYLMKSNCLFLTQCNKWHAQISAENRSNDSNQFIASAKCRWLFLIHQFFLIFNSVSVFQEWNIIVLSSFSSPFDKVQPSPWKTETFIASPVISAPLFFVFHNEMILGKRKVLSDGCVWICVSAFVCECLCVCVRCDFIICCFSHVCHICIFLLFMAVLSWSCDCVWGTKTIWTYTPLLSQTECYGQTFEQLLCCPREQIRFTLLVRIFFPTAQKTMDIQRKKSYLAFAGCKRMLLTKMLAEQYIYLRVMWLWE